MARKKKNKRIEIITSLQCTEQSHSASISIISEDEIGFCTKPPSRTCVSLYLLHIDNHNTHSTSKVGPICLHKFKDLLRVE